MCVAAQTEKESREKIEGFKYRAADCLESLISESEEKITL